jgi:2'-5' RNA ligase
MRLFTALDLPPDILLRVEQLLSQLRPAAAIHWSPPDNLHITTKFIGVWPDDRLEELNSALDRLRFREPFDITLQDMGWFPNAHAPRSLWAGVHCEALPHFAALTEQSLAELGIARDPHPFSPHLTLARIRDRVPLQPLKTKVEELKTLPIGHFLAPHFYLYRSDPGTHSSVYRKLRTYTFELNP